VFGEVKPTCSIDGENEIDEGKDAMKGLKALAAVVLASGLLASAMPASAGAAGFRHYVACGLGRTAKPAHSCPKRSKKGAFFKSPMADVVYSVCVRFPSGLNRCVHDQEATQGTLYVNTITSTIPGKHRVTWFVKGQKVGATIFTVTG
jgi:hypothetical protein